MDSNKLYNSDYLDILFKGKNKSYGAYQLRRGYNKRIRNATLISVIGLSLLLILAAVGSNVSTESEDLVLKEVELGDPPPMSKNEPPPPPPPPVEPPPPVRAQVKFTPPVIKKDNEIEVSETFDKKDIAEKDIGTKDVEGTSNKESFQKEIEFTKEKKTEVAKVEEPKKEDNKIYDFVEQEASYPGGESAILTDISRNFSYPAIARENGIEGTVYVKFVVEKNGSISGVRATRKLGYGLDEAAVNAVKQLKRFTPAKQNGQPVRSYFSVPIRCVLQ